jgi:hypothetical protein
MTRPRQWTEDAIVAAVLAFYQREQRWPGRADFEPEHQLPNRNLVDRRMRTWQEAVRQAQAVQQEDAR